MATINITVSGKRATGKSTALLYIARKLIKLGYPVIIPEHLRGKKPESMQSVSRGIRIIISEKDEGEE